MKKNHNMFDYSEKIIRQALDIIDCQISDYETVFEMQLRCLDQAVNEEGRGFVILVEHYPVITLGANEIENKFAESSHNIAQAGIDVIRTRRGGGTTAHNPGQLVVYPIINLRSIGLGVNEYIRELENVGIELLKGFGLVAERLAGYPGLWIENRKISSIGVRVSKGVTHHGMAINIANDLSIFDSIVPCGIEGVQMTSLQNELADSGGIDEVKVRLKQILTDRWAKRGLV